MSLNTNKKFAKAIAVLLSATMIMGMSLTAFATDPATEAGSGNILAYVNETYIVPTSLKVALNPNQLTMNLRYKKADTTFSASKTYYTYDGDTKKYVYVANPVEGSIANYYEADTSTDQIVSFNYGIVNESTKAKKVKVSLAVAGNAANTGDGFSDITFVDSADKATAVSASNEDGAAFGEFKMYLAVAPSTALPTADTYAKTTDTEIDSSKTYYKKAEGVYTESSDNAFASGTTYYEATTTIGTEIQASELADVTMTPVAAAKQTVFAAGDTASTAAADIAYKLGEATYSPKKGEIIDFSTTQAQLAEKVELTAIGGVAAFTITGAMNKNTDWTKAKATVISITPTYEVLDADGTETEVAEGGYNQIEAAASSGGNSTPAGRVLTLQSSGNLTYTFEEGTAPEGELTACVINGVGRAGLVSGGKITYNATNGFFKITAEAIQTAEITEGSTTVVATIGGQEYTFTY